MPGTRALKNDDGGVFIAIKGTIKQAVMLGLAATISHTAVVWLIAFGGMVISKRFTAQSAEP
ncbi:nickel/cobalt efflux protein RcnA [Escherichia coli]|uniref:Nickel/cobalt efflux protein RcnA n=1 Tax=Escherichia coli TaxID=562 RepID=A0A376U6Y8_ECOLX|nr:nickel/cobalt efflux protein RcnA [Escherichia coli]